MYYRFMKILLQKQTNVWSLDTAKAYIYEGRNGEGVQLVWRIVRSPKKVLLFRESIRWDMTEAKAQTVRCR